MHTREREPSSPSPSAFCPFCTNFPGENGKMANLLARGVAASCVCEICNNSVKKHEGSGPRLGWFFMKSRSHTQREMHFRVRRRLDKEKHKNWPAHLAEKLKKLKTGSQMLRDHIIQVVSQSAPLSDEVLVNANAPWSQISGMWVEQVLIKLLI